jgi:hypothetical protein
MTQLNKETLQEFTTWHLLKTTLLEWNADNAAHLSAALAYYTFFPWRRSSLSRQQSPAPSLVRKRHAGNWSIRLPCILAMMLLF